jgi:hypothetical protein
MSIKKLELTQLLSREILELCTASGADGTEARAAIDAARAMLPLLGLEEQPTVVIGDAL